MTIWVPDISQSGKPAYLAIADAIGDAIRLGHLRAGQPLPTHRLLADLLGVNVSTITRAYKEAARRRLVGGEVGRGTYVLATTSEAAIFALQQRPEGGVIDLSTNMPPVRLHDPDLAAALDTLGPGDAARLLHYPGPADLLLHRQAAANWLGRRGVDASPDSLIVCAGAQHAMDTALGLFSEAEEVVCESLVYPGLKAVARHVRRRLHPIPMDDDGIVPEQFEQACRAGARLAVISPTLHNPTSTTMSAERRTRIVQIARRWNVVIVEEDVYGLLPDSPPPALATLAPERVVYLTGLSKTVAPGLRLGYLVVPPILQDRMRAIEHHTAWYVSPISMAIASRWLTDGTAWRRLLAQRRELQARHRLCTRLLEEFDWKGTPQCPHVWLVAPPGGSQLFAKRALAAGVVVVPASVLAAGRALYVDGLRISIGAATDRGTLAEGLARLAELGTVSAGR